MNGDRWTILWVRGEESPVRQYALSRKALRRIAAGGVALLLFGLASAAFIGIGGLSRLEAHRIAEENETLREELSTVRGRVAELEGTLETLASRDADMRRIAGLDPLGDDLLRVGVGGPGLATPESHPLYDLDPALGEGAFAVGYDLDALERRASLLSESMAEAADSLRAHRDLLRATPSILPTAGLLSSRFSRQRQHPLYDRALPHEGIDISAPRGTPVLAAADGRVARAGWMTGYGQMVEIDHGFGYVTRYGHASRIMVRVGEHVERGAVVARVGNSGIATSSHLHYEVRLHGRAQNPMNYVLPEGIP